MIGLALSALLSWIAAFAIFKSGRLAGILLSLGAFAPIGLPPILVGANGFVLVAAVYSFFLPKVILAAPATAGPGPAAPPAKTA